MIATQSPWQAFQSDVLAATHAGMLDQVARWTWSAAQIQQAQRDGLRRLLVHAVEHSPFHRGRLAGIDPTTIDPADLSALPVMTKADMMDALDDVFTDRRLSVTKIEEALAVTGAEPVPILDEYVALASGGCSGRRGLFVFDRTALTLFTAAVARPPLGAPVVPAVGATGGVGVAMVAAPSAVHATGCISALVSGEGWPASFELVPATLPIAEVVARLNAMQPPVLSGYASMLTRLAAEARAGRLRIRPLQVSNTSETLLPEMRSVIGEAFGVPVSDGFGSSEGLFGKAGPGDETFTFNTDMCIVELVDADNRPVAPGRPSAKVLLTNLFNLAQPLIRYELNDVFIRQPDAPDRGYLRARVQGRSDEVLHYGSTDVHPVVIRSVMVRSPDVIDYQVRQTGRGIDVSVVAAALDVESLTASLRRALLAAGLADAQVAVTQVDRLQRHLGSGKLRRFVPENVAQSV